jgi:hypothetical protein
MRSNGGAAGERIVVIGIPDSRRVSAFCEAAQRCGVERVDVVSYLDWIAGRRPPPAGSLVRIDSPGECSQTTRAILKAGIAPLEARGGLPLSVAEIDRLACGRGELLSPRQWFLGYREILEQIDIGWADAGLRWMSRPKSIVTAFDKIACLELWSRAGLPIPRRYPGIARYEQLRGEIARRHARLFVKLRYGYSALGAVALEWRDSLVRAITTVEVTGPRDRARLFVSKRPRVLTCESEIAWLIDRLGVEDILVEHWLPKARSGGKPFDLRVVMIGGEPQHVVGRANTSPFTNLNLNATRIAPEEVKRQLGETWEHLGAVCRQAALQIPTAGGLGLDVLVRPCLRQLALLEANAFGDYLPGLLYRGRSTYEAEVHRFCGERAGVPA